MKIPQRSMLTFLLMDLFLGRKAGRFGIKLLMLISRIKPENLFQAFATQVTTIHTGINPASRHPSKKHIHTPITAPQMHPR